MIIIHGLALLSTQSAFSAPEGSKNSVKTDDLEEVLPLKCYQTLAALGKARAQITKLQNEFAEKSEIDATDTDLERIVEQLNAQLKIVKTAETQKASACE